MHLNVGYMCSCVDFTWSESVYAVIIIWYLPSEAAEMPFAAVRELYTK